MLPGTLVRSDQRPHLAMVQRRARLEIGERAQRFELEETLVSVALDGSAEVGVFAESWWSGDHLTKSLSPRS